jgi:hypothetical protein
VVVVDCDMMLSVFVDSIIDSEFSLEMPNFAPTPTPAILPPTSKPALKLLVAALPQVLVSELVYVR